jgi:hypothetical protein
MSSAPNDDARDEPRCRYCLSAFANEDDGEGDGDEPLIDPCDCSGSARWVHASCLEAWRIALDRGTSVQRETCAQIKCEMCHGTLRTKSTLARSLLTCIETLTLRAPLSLAALAVHDDALMPVTTTALSMASACIMGGLSKGRRFSLGEFLVCSGFAVVGTMMTDVAAAVAEMCTAAPRSRRPFTLPENPTVRQQVLAPILAEIEVIHRAELPFRVWADPYQPWLLPMFDRRRIGHAADLYADEDNGGAPLTPFAYHSHFGYMHILAQLDIAAQQILHPERPVPSWPYLGLKSTFKAILYIAKAPFKRYVNTLSAMWTYIRDAHNTIAAENTTFVARTAPHFPTRKPIGLLNLVAEGLPDEYRTNDHIII